MSDFDVIKDPSGQWGVKQAQATWVPIQRRHVKAAKPADAKRLHTANGGELGSIIGSLGADLETQVAQLRRTA